MKKPVTIGRVHMVLNGRDIMAEPAELARLLREEQQRLSLIEHLLSQVIHQGHPFTPAEMQWLEDIRDHHFDAQACGHDAAYPFSRREADRQIKHLIAKALLFSDGDVEKAARLLAGEHAETYADALQKIKYALRGWRRQLTLYGSPAMRRRFERLPPAHASIMLQLLQALETGIFFLTIDG